MCIALALAVTLALVFFGRFFRTSAFNRDFKSEGDGMVQYLIQMITVLQLDGVVLDTSVDIEGFGAVNKDSSE